MTGRADGPGGAPGRVTSDGTDQLPAGVHRLSAAGVEVLVHLPGAGLPEVLHWGAPLGDVAGAALLRAVGRGVSHSALDEPWPLTLVPTDSDGWQGRPALAAHQDGALLLGRWSGVVSRGDGRRLVVTARTGALAVQVELRLDDAGVLRVAHTLTNRSDRPVEVVAVEAVLPVGEQVAEGLDFSGRWTREREPQRTPLVQGSRVRESRRGRTGHDSPLALVLGEPGFRDDAGEVWAVHLAWSADAVYRQDVLPEARPVLGAGPLLRPGELVLAAGESYRTPDAVFVWSDRGLDGLSDRLHATVRAGHRPVRPHRPVTLNTWEAVYFQHDGDRLVHLAELAAGIGVERFVLDDGWFRGRRSDRAGLGDWTVDPAVWPAGLHPLADRVHGLGMQFGLWVEPEMVNLDSEVARRHPDWLLGPAGAPGRTWRHQHVLDLTRPAAVDHVVDAVSALVSEYRLDYLKWDQNRDLLEAVHDGRAATLRQTEAFYAVLDELRSRFPGLEIESCASGGARVDLGVLARTDRVWASDTNDPLERLGIQRWTGLLVPPEDIGTHVGPPVSHTTGRHADLGLRIAVALLGSMGIEWDIATCTPEELAQLRDGLAAHRRLRPLLHTGRTRHLPDPDPGTRATAVLAPDGSAAVVRVVRLTTSDRALPPLLRLPGLEADARYRVTPVPELRPPRVLEDAPAPWLTDGQTVGTGRSLGRLGLRLPLMAPEQALVLQVERVDER